MKLSGTVLEDLVAVVKDFRFDIETIDLDCKEVRLKNNGWKALDEVEIEFSLNLNSAKSEILEKVVIEEKEQYQLKLQQLNAVERGLKDRECNLQRELSNFNFERQRAEERLEEEKRRFDAYVSQTLFNLNKVLENLKNLDEMKKPTEDYLKFEDDIFKKRRSGQL